MNTQQISYKKREEQSTLQQQYLYISLFSFPVAVLFVIFFSDVWNSHLIFSYKLVAIFLVFVFISNFFSKLTIRILRRA